MADTSEYSIIIKFKQVFKTDASGNIVTYIEPIRELPTPPTDIEGKLIITICFKRPWQNIKVSVPRSKKIIEEKNRIVFEYKLKSNQKRLIFRAGFFGDPPKNYSFLLKK